MLGKIVMAPPARALAKVLSVGWEISLMDTPINPQRPALHLAHRMHHE